MSADFPRIGRRQRVENRRPVATFPYALWVPILVVLMQSAISAHSGNGYGMLLWGTYSNGYLAFLAVLFAISYGVIRPFVNDWRTRWCAFLCCIFGFTAFILLSIPSVAE